MHPLDLEQLNVFKLPKEPCYKLVSSLDAISLLRRDVRSLVAPEDLERLVPPPKASAPWATSLNSPLTPSSTAAASSGSKPPPPKGGGGGRRLKVAGRG